MGPVGDFLDILLQNVRDKTYPHLPVPFIFGNKGLYLPDIIGNSELFAKNIGNWKIRDRLLELLPKFIMDDTYTWSVQKLLRIQYGYSSMPQYPKRSFETK